MNEVVISLRLRELMAVPDGWGTLQGEEVHKKLLDLVVGSTATVISISLAGVDKTDVSFPRESVVALAKKLRCKKGVCLLDLVDNDLRENWHSAALRSEQPLVAWSGDSYEIIGPMPSLGCADVFNYLMRRGTTTARDIAEEFKLKIPNASMKLKQLFDSGFVLRREDIAPSGGVEFFYSSIKS